MILFSAHKKDVLSDLLFAILLYACYGSVLRYTYNVCYALSINWHSRAYIWYVEFALVVSQVHAYPGPSLQPRFGVCQCVMTKMDQVIDYFLLGVGCPLAR